MASDRFGRIRVFMFLLVGDRGPVVSTLGLFSCLNLLIFRHSYAI